MPSDGRPLGALGDRVEPALVERLGDERQTSGCMRRVWSRKMPRSSGIVSCSPSRCSSTEAPEPARVDALRDLGELERVAEQDRSSAPTVPIASASASEIWPASSITSKSSVSSSSSRAKSHAVPAMRANVRVGELVASRRCLMNAPVVLLALLQAPKSSRSSRGRPLDLVEQVVDRLVALRCDARPASRRAISAVISRAPRYVLPEPGGPWTKR